MKRSFTQNFLAKIWITLGVFLVLGTFMFNYGHAATQPDAFIVEVQPSSFDINEAVDITIKAVTANGDIVKDYQGDVFIEIDGIADTADYVVPSEWLYTFVAQDQWVKLFSKGLIVKRQGTFAVKVSDIIDESIAGEKTIIVGSSTNWSATESIGIASPAADGIEKNNIVNIIANAPQLPNSPYDIYLNNSIVAQGTTDIIGDINAYISGVIAGQNLLQIKISNAQNEIIGQSESMRFTYSPIRDGVFDSIQILPGTKVKQWTKATFNISTSDSVTSAKISLSNGKTLPMDRKTAWLFTKEILMDTDGSIDVGTELINWWSTKTYTGIAIIIVEKSISIGKIRLYSDSVDKTKLNVTRETVGTAAQYKVQYGTSEDLLDQFVIAPTNEIAIKNLIIGKTYYFQIIPLDGSETIIGEASPVTQTTVGQDLSCIVKNITVSDQKIGDKYYLVWSWVENADKYIIYRSEFETNDSSKMQKVGETTGTMFEYPFNKASKTDQYAYYLVEAACKDGTNLKIDNARKIKVWPVENILLFIVIALFGYCIYKLYRYSEN
jgi:hypothetical protein